MNNLQLQSIYFVIIGIGYLFPFSAMTLPVDYWRLLFPSENILFSISCVFLYTNLILLSYLVFFTKENSNNSFNTRIIGGFIGQLLCLIIIPSSYFLKLDENLNKVVVLVSTGIMALATAFLDSSLISLSGCFPQRCQASLQLGVGLSTLIGCFYRVFTKLAFPATDDGTVLSSLVYFYTGSFTLLLCLFVYGLLMRMPSSKEYLSEAIEEDEAIEKEDESSPLIQRQEDFSRSKAFKISFLNGFYVALLFVTTTVVWPGLMADIPTFQFLDTLGLDWWSLLLLNIYALTDVLGRFMVPFRFGLTKDTIWIPVVLRILLIPFLIVIVKGIFFLHDGFSILFVSLLGWTNGWCGSLTIIMLNEISENALEKRYIGTLASFFLNGGLVVGATVAFAAFGKF